MPKFSFVLLQICHWWEMVGQWQTAGFFLLPFGYPTSVKKDQNYFYYLYFCFVVFNDLDSNNKFWSTLIFCSLVCFLGIGGFEELVGHKFSSLLYLTAIFSSLFWFVCTTTHYFLTRSLAITFLPLENTTQVLHGLSSRNR